MQVMNLIEICYEDADVLVCVKPPRVLSTDEPGGLPSLLRQTLGKPEADIRTIHRLDRGVGGLMVLARNPHAASELSRQVREGAFEKQYWAVLHGTPEQKEDTLCDLLGRDKARKMTFVADAPAKGVQEASLSYQVLAQKEDASLVQIQLHTGRTHQIRVQFASRGYPLVGDHKYGARDEAVAPMLFSCALTFPLGGKTMHFEHLPEWGNCIIIKQEP